jgi:ABC-type nitrate/sulfonate/bicarbonate transport system substrate-binding protein
MRRVVALLAAALLLAGVAGCGGSGAEPGVPKGATLVLDFTPNAVHTGIYAAKAEGFYEDAGVDLKIEPPGESTDAPKLLAAGRADFAILDIHDFGIAWEHDGLSSVAAMPLVQRPLAAVMSAFNGPIERPRDLEGHTVGVTGLPSDEAVVDSVVSADGGDPSKVKRVTIGFSAVTALAAHKVDAVTGFWNAEGVALEHTSVPPKIFKVDRYGAPPYPELVMATADDPSPAHRKLVERVVDATRRGYAFTEAHPQQALLDLLGANPALISGEQEAQLQALLPDLNPKPFDQAVLREWAGWDFEHGLLHKRPGRQDLEAMFQNIP